FRSRLSPPGRHYAPESGLRSSQPLSTTSTTCAGSAPSARSPSKARSRSWSWFPIRLADGGSCLREAFARTQPPEMGNPVRVPYPQAAMSFTETALLGALAGFTIYLGLPFGRLQLLSDRARVGLAMFSVGVLAFIFVDVMEHAFGIAEGAVE